MNKILQFIPGFRTKILWKMAIAIIYYISAISLTFTHGLYCCLLAISLPFIFFGVWSGLKAFSFKRQPLLYIGSVPFILSLLVGPPTKNTTETKPVPTPTATVVATAAPDTSAEPSPVPTPIVTPAPTDTPAPPPVDTPKPTPVENTVTNDEITQTVWVGNTGTKYHYQNCGTLKGKGHEIPLSQAVAEGRQPCKSCH